MAASAVVPVSRCESAYLDEVVCEYAVPAPGSGSVDAGEFGAVPAVASFEVADPAFGSGSPFDLGAEGPPCSNSRRAAPGLPLRGIATVSELDRFTQASFADRAGLDIVQADQPAD